MFYGWGSRVQVLRVKGVWFMVWGLGSRVKVLASRVEGVGFRLAREPVCSVRPLILGTRFVRPRY